MEKNLFIRNAQMNDAKDLVPFLDQLGYPQTLKEIEEKLKIYNGKDQYILFVAEQNKKIVGILAFSVHPIFVSRHYKLAIEEFVVDENARNEGVGTMLIKKMETVAEEKNCSVIEIISAKKREHAHRFYRFLGYTNEKDNEKVYFRKDLL